MDQFKSVNDLKQLISAVSYERDHILFKKNIDAHKLRTIYFAIESKQIKYLDDFEYIPAISSRDCQHIKSDKMKKQYLVKFNYAMPKITDIYKQNIKDLAVDTISQSLNDIIIIRVKKYSYVSGPLDAYTNIDCFACIYLDHSTSVIKHILCTVKTKYLHFLSSSQPAYPEDISINKPIIYSYTDKYGGTFNKYMSIENIIRRYHLLITALGNKFGYTNLVHSLS